MKNLKTELNPDCIRVSLKQGSPTLLLEIYRPTDVSSNPNQTHLNQLIKVSRATW